MKLFSWVVLYMKKSDTKREGQRAEERETYKVYKNFI